MIKANSRAVWDRYLVSKRQWYAHPSLHTVLPPLPNKRVLDEPGLLAALVEQLNHRARNVVAPLLRCSFGTVLPRQSDWDSTILLGS